MDNFNFLNSMKKGFIPFLSVMLSLKVSQATVAQAPTPVTIDIGADLTASADNSAAPSDS